MEKAIKELNQTLKSLPHLYSYKISDVFLSLENIESLNFSIIKETRPYKLYVNVQVMPTDNSKKDFYLRILNRINDSFYVMDKLITTKDSLKSEDYFFYFQEAIRQFARRNPAKTRIFEEYAALMEM